MKNIKDVLIYLEKEKNYYEKLKENALDMFILSNDEKFKDFYRDYHVIFYTYKFLINKIKGEIENEK